MTITTTSTRGRAARARRVLAFSAVLALALPTVGAAPASAASPPEAAFGQISGGRNVALAEAGTTVIGRSSSIGGCWEPIYMLNYSSDCGWHTNYNDYLGAWVKFELAGGGTYLVDSFQIRTYSCECWRVKDFTIAVSTTTADDAAFTTVVSSTFANAYSSQTFTLPQPVPARYVKYTGLNIRTNYGYGYSATEAFRVMTQTQGGRTVTFQNRSTDVDGDIAAYRWDFGDGTTSSQTNPLHAFPPGSGAYDVALTVTDALGATDTETIRQTVLVAPVADFTGSPTAIPEGTSVTFTDTSTDPDGGALHSRYWTFGNGGATPSSGPSVSYNYCDNGSYTVGLSVVDDDERGASASKPNYVTVTNRPPVVNAYADRMWLGDERLFFAPGITDPGCDSHTHSWTFSDIGVQNNAYYYDRTITVPLGSPPVKVTGTYTARDDDGASASDTMETTFFARAFQAQSAGGVPGLYGVDFDPLLNSTVVLWDQGSCRLRLSISTPDGALRHLGGNLARGCGESDLAISRGTGGFAVGELLVGNGAAGQLARLATDASGAVTSSANPWVTIPGVTARLGGLAFDTSGSFGGDLLTVWTDGKVFRTSADGTSTLVAALGKLLEGAAIAPATGFGPASGCLLTTDASLKNVIAVCADGTTSVVRNLPAGGNLESLALVTSAGDLIATDHDRNQLQRADSRTFTSAQAGHVMVATATGGEIWDLAYDEAGGAFTASPFALLMRPGEGGATTRVEQIAFVPALLSTRTTLSPATATLRVGAEHTVSAVVLDSTGNPVPGVELTFRVSGANTVTGTATTGADGSASLTYAGSVAGDDEIVASASGISTAPVRATWVRMGTTLRATPALASATADGNEVTAKLRARLVEEDGEALAGKVVTFSATDPATAQPAVVCTATTDADGVAECADPAHVSGAAAGSGYRAVFAGDGSYADSDATAPLVLIDRDLP